MSLEVARQNIATHNVTSPVGAPLVAEANGQRRNETVVQKNMTSKITDAAEELGLAVSSRLDRKSLETRSIRQGQGANIEAIERIAEYYEKLPDMPDHDKLQSLVRRLQDFQNQLSSGGGGGQLTPQDLFSFLREFDGDVTHQFAGLQIAIEHFEAVGGHEELLEVLHEASNLMQEGELGREVRAGFAIAQLANDNAEEFGTDPAELREHYRDLLRTEPNFGVIFDKFKELIAKQQSLNHAVDGEAATPLNSFDDVVELFTQAAGHGLELADTVDEPAQLQSLLEELGKLKSLRTVYEGVHHAAQLAARISPVFGEIANDNGLDSMASGVFHFLGKAVVAPADAQALVADFAPAGVKATLDYSNNLLNLHRDVPDTILENANIRIQQYNTLLGLSEQLTILEEQQYNASATGEGERVEPRLGEIVG